MKTAVLVQAATRGDGVTASHLPQARTIRDIPLRIPYTGRLEVQGECIMRLSALEKYNETAAVPLKNARNGAAGALRNLDPAVTAARRLSAFFYQVGTIDAPPYHDQPGMLDFIRSAGLARQPVFPHRAHGAGGRRLRARNRRRPRIAGFPDRRRGYQDPGQPHPRGAGLYR